MFLLNSLFKSIIDQEKIFNSNSFAVIICSFELKTREKIQLK